MELSRRLQAVADLVSEGVIVADVGTDHGYIPIYLLKEGKGLRAIAMDINQGPLSRATAHIFEQGLSERIETRLSDGVRQLKVGECECVVIAGMGGALTIHILEEGKEVFRSLKEFVLQPQSEIRKVRQYLNENGYCVIEENMVLEDGKYYPMMRVINAADSKYSLVELRYGRGLLNQKHPVLKMFLEKEVNGKQMIIQNLQAQAGEHIKVRIEELENELDIIKETLAVYF
jgi:tRNA (adenine22-N1)-methyltransferase